MRFAWVDHSGKKRFDLSLTMLHLLPSLHGGICFFVRDMVIGGGPIYEKLDVISLASALLLGFPEVPGFFGAAVVSVLILGAVGANSLRQEYDTLWLFFPPYCFSLRPC